MGHHIKRLAKNFQGDEHTCESPVRRCNRGGSGYSVLHYGLNSYDSVRTGIGLVNLGTNYALVPDLCFLLDRLGNDLIVRKSCHGGFGGAQLNKLSPQPHVQFLLRAICAAR